MPRALKTSVETAEQPKANAIPKKRRLSTWFEGRLVRRVQALDQHELTSRRIYIFLTTEGGLFALTLLCLFLAGVNYANNLVLGLCFFLVAVFVVSFHVTHAQLLKLRVKLIETMPAEVGSVAVVTLELQERLGRGRQLRCELLGQRAVECSLLEEREVLELSLVGERTGLCELPALKVSSCYPFGLTRSWAYMRLKTPVFFWPKPFETRVPPLESEHQQKKAEPEPLSALGGSEDFDRLRQHEPGEGTRRISWRHYARGQGLLSLQFSESKAHGRCLSYARTKGASADARYGELVHWVTTYARMNKPFSLKIGAHTLKQGSGRLHELEALRRIAIAHASSTRTSREGRS